MRPAFLIVSFAFVLGSALSGCNPSSPERVRSENDPNVINVSDDDAEMNAAIAQAKATLDQFIPHVQAPSPTQTAALKIRFEDANGVEHMWLSDLTYENGKFTGTLDDTPLVVETVTMGQRVTVSQEDVSDWVLVDGGKRYGGYSIEILMKNMSPEEQAQMNQAMGVQ